MLSSLRSSPRWEGTTRAMENIDRNDAPPNSKAESILAAAKRSFLAAGFGAVSMDAIAREAGVSKATVYAHFAGKEELFGAMIARECERYFARFSAGELDPCDVRASLTVLGRQTRQEAPRDDLLSGVHALLHAEPEGQLQDWNAHREISLAAQSHVVAGTAATNPALVGPGTGQHSQRRAEGPLRLLRHCRKLSFPAKGPSGGRTLLAQNAVQPELGRAHHVGHVPPDQTAA